ncbi:MAG TPA: VTT domain-containing protein [Amycolatopsis sp.]|nr:VTT domain-containing protein [Amycolatopsis sp.]
MILAETTTTLALMPNWFNPEYLLTQFGAYVIIGLCLVIFIESSVFPVLPGDSLLFTAGLFVAQGSIHAPLWLVCLVVSVAALLGNVVGYFLGYKVGPALFKRPDSRFFKQEYVEKTHAFLDHHGPKAVILARFVPFVRTFITWIAGVGRMDPKKYFTYTVIGGIAWAAGITALGHVLGNISFIKNNIEAIFIVIVLVSVLPIVVEWARNRRSRTQTAGAGASADAGARADTDATQQIPRIDR